MQSVIGLEFHMLVLYHYHLVSREEFQDPRRGFQDDDHQ